MNRTLFQTRRCALLLLFIFVYQLGAGPCGCLQHNGWYQIGKSCLSACVSLAEDAGQRTRPADVCNEGDHCDDHTPVVYLASRCLLERDASVAKIEIPKGGILNASSVFCCRFSVFAVRSGSSDRTSALPVRAEFQVFLI